MESLIIKNKIEYTKFTVVIIIAEIAWFVELHLFTSIFACNIWIHVAVPLFNPSHKTVPQIYINTNKNI
jgi:hypothetical protein